MTRTILVTNYGCSLLFILILLDFFSLTIHKNKIIWLSFLSPVFLLILFQFSIFCIGFSASFRLPLFILYSSYQIANFSTSIYKGTYIRHSLFICTFFYRTFQLQRCLPLLPGYIFVFHNMLLQMGASIFYLFSYLIKGR